MATLLASDPRRGFGLSCPGSRSAAWRRRRARDFVFQVIEVSVAVGVFSVGWLHSSEGDLFKSSARKVDFDAGLGFFLYAEWTLVRRREWRVYAPPTDHDMSRVVKVLWDVDIRDSMS